MTSSGHKLCAPMVPFPDATFYPTYLFLPYFECFDILAVCFTVERLAVEKVVRFAAEKWQLENYRGKVAVTRLADVVLVVGKLGPCSH